MDYAAKEKGILKADLFGKNKMTNMERELQEEGTIQRGLGDSKKKGLQRERTTW